MTIWRPGMKAVCVDAHSRIGGYCPLIEGRVYTVATVGSSDRDLGVYTGRFEDSGVAITLEEIVTPIPNGLGSFWPYFNAARFRPAHDLTATVEEIKRKALNVPAERVGA